MAGAALAKSRWWIGSSSRPCSGVPASAARRVRWRLMSII